MKSKEIKNRIMFFCIFVIFFFAFSIIIRFLARQLLVEKWGMNNALTHLIFVGKEEIGIVKNEVDGNKDAVDIAWKTIYPYAEPPLKTNAKFMMRDKYQGIIEWAKEKIEQYAGDFLIGYDQIIYLAKKYESALGWNISVYTGYNSAVKLEDGYWTGFKGKVDVAEQAASVINLCNYCMNNGTDFLYVQVPNKICKYQDEGISGTLDFSQQVSDDLLERLEKNDVPVFDLREEIDHENRNHHDLFYKTDHHWKAETGLWAAGILAEYCNAKFGYGIDLSLFVTDNFEFHKYEDWFLGSYGKKVTLAQTQPEDFCLIYPKYETDIHLIAYDQKVDREGDFSVIYNMAQVTEKDYYNLNPYGAYAYGDPACLDIYNNLVDGKHVLIISDSFDNVSTPFFALGVGRVTSLDRRCFDGSIETYILEEKPDLVVVMYQAGAIVDINWEINTSLFDFR